MSEIDPTQRASSKLHPRKTTSVANTPQSPENGDTPMASAEGPAAKAARLDAATRTVKQALGTPAEAEPAEAKKKRAPRKTTSKAPAARTAKPKTRSTKATKATRTTKAAVSRKAESATPRVERPALQRLAVAPSNGSAHAKASASRVSAEERTRLIREAAYGRALRRGFRNGTPEQDWIEAEAEVDRMLAGKASG